MGFWLWNINSTHFFDFHMWKCHFACPATILRLRSPQHPIKCSRRCFVPHILQWDGDPTAGASPQNLGGITPTQFCLLYKALGGIIFPTLQIFKFSRLTNSQTFRTFQFSESSRFFKKSFKPLRILGSNPHVHSHKFFSLLGSYLLGQSPWPTVLCFLSLKISFISP